MGMDHKTAGSSCLRCQSRGIEGDIGPPLELLPLLGHLDIAKED